MSPEELTAQITAAHPNTVVKPENRGGGDRVYSRNSSTSYLYRTRLLVNGHVRVTLYARPSGVYLIKLWSSWGPHTRLTKLKRGTTSAPMEEISRKITDLERLSIDTKFLWDAREVESERLCKENCRRRAFIASQALKKILPADGHVVVDTIWPGTNRPSKPMYFVMIEAHSEEDVFRLIEELTPNHNKGTTE